MKYPIQWHKDCLKSHLRTLAEQREQLARLQADIERSQRDYDFHSLQVETAEKQGKDGFDLDRFLKVKP